MTSSDRSALASNLSRNLFGNPSNVGRGKGNLTMDDFLRLKAAKDKDEATEVLYSLYHTTSPQKVKKARVSKKSKQEVLKPDVLAKISDLDMVAVESALKSFLNKKIQDVVVARGDDGRTVTLANVMKVLKDAKRGMSEKSKDPEKSTEPEKHVLWLM